MKKTQVISGAVEHQIALDPDRRLAGSKRANRQAAPADGTAPPPRRKRLPTEPELKKPPLEPISEDTVEALDAQLDARIRQIGQVTQQLRAELDTLNRSASDRG